MQTCTNNKALRGGPAIIHVTSPSFTRRDIRADIASFDPRTQVPQDAAGLGFTITDRNCYMEFQLPDDCNLSVADFTSICNAGVTFRLINGKAYAMREAWFSSEDLGFTSSEGLFTMRFSSQHPMEEVLGC